MIALSLLWRPCANRVARLSADGLMEGFFSSDLSILVTFNRSSMVIYKFPEYGEVKKNAMFFSSVEVKK